METTLENSPAYRSALCRVRQLRGFYTHLSVYLAVNAGLLVINLVSSPGRLWVVWPLAGWGIGLLIHAAGVFLGGRWLGAEWERRKVEELVARQRKADGR
ncbi:MAG: 2TM domain-containing protein [Caenispirillum sp.]|nr:2TM domain-containing protein [Caenispirillum sp.]